MIKLAIDNIDVEFEAKGGTCRLYRFYFNKDLIKDMLKLAKASKKNETDDIQKNSLSSDLDALEKVDSDTFEKVDMEMLENMAWAMAKTANPKIPEISEWLNQFEPMSLYPHFKTLLLEFFKSYQMTVEEKKKLLKTTKPKRKR